MTDVTGKVVRQLVQNKELDGGRYNVLFERKDLANGMYFVVLENGQEKVVKKFILN